MKNETHRIMIAILFVGLLAAMQPSCSGSLKTGSSDEKGNQKIKMRVITDMTGRQVTIPPPDYIRRIAVLTSPQVLNAYAVGVSEELCAVTNSVKRWKLLAKANPRLKDVPAPRAGNAQINIEALLQTNPDLCIGSESDMRPIEKSTKLPTLRISLGIPGDYFKSIRQEVAFFGIVFGKEERVRTFDKYLDDALERVKAATEAAQEKKKLKVYMGFDADHLTTYGGGTFMDEWIDAAGCVNSAGAVRSPGGKEGGLAGISMEQLVGWNPDIIIIDTGKPEDLYSKQVWSELSAVKNKNVFRLPMGVFLWNRPSCESAVLFPQWLAVTAYPDRFRSFDFKNYCKSFYADVLGLDIAVGDINQMINPLEQ
jgi:iron complex transport system substrate-binding protein